MNIKVIDNNTNNKKDKNVIDYQKYTRAKYLIEKQELQNQAWNKYNPCTTGLIMNYCCKACYSNVFSIMNSPQYMEIRHWILVHSQINLNEI